MICSRSFLSPTHAAITQHYAHLADASLRQSTVLFGDKLEKIVVEEEN